MDNDRSRSGFPCPSKRYAGLRPGASLNLPALSIFIAVAEFCGNGEPNYLTATSILRPEPGGDVAPSLLARADEVIE
jgi:hypothetical protein